MEFGWGDQAADRLHDFCLKSPELPGRQAVIGSSLARPRFADIFAELSEGRGEHCLASPPVAIGDRDEEAGCEDDRSKICQQGRNIEFYGQTFAANHLRDADDFVAGDGVKALLAPVGIPRLILAVSLVATGKTATLGAQIGKCQGIVPAQFRLWNDFPVFVVGIDHELDPREITVPLFREFQAWGHNAWLDLKTDPFTLCEKDRPILHHGKGGIAKSANAAKDGFQAFAFRPAAAAVKNVRLWGESQRGIQVVAIQHRIAVHFAELEDAGVGPGVSKEQLFPEINEVRQPRGDQPSQCLP